MKTIKVTAKLESGQEVELEKTCQCVTHTGPCWVAYDEAWHATNRKLIEPPLSWLGAIAFPREEIERLTALEHELTSRHIISYKIEVLNEF